MLELNLTAPFRLVRRTLPAMAEARLGSGGGDRVGGGQAR